MSDETGTGDRAGMSDETGTGEVAGTGSADGPRPSARDLVRKRSRTYKAPETGRHHHIGAAPELQPVLGEDGSSSYVGTSDVQLASRTTAQLRQQRDELARRMQDAAAELRFEQAAALRDDVDRVVAELESRS